MEHTGTLSDLGLKSAGFKAKNCPVLVLVLVAVLVLVFGNSLISDTQN